MKMTLKEVIRSADQIKMVSGNSTISMFTDIVEATEYNPFEEQFAVFEVDGIAPFGAPSQLEVEIDNQGQFTLDLYQDVYYSIDHKMTVTLLALIHIPFSAETRAKKLLGVL